MVDGGTNSIWLLLGCTGVGKTDASLVVAERGGAEIVCVDSMQVYRGMDIGTAKPTPAMRERVRHHLIDVADASEAYSASRFVAEADAAIADIHSRGKRALVIAGTPFYLMGLLYGLFDGPSADEGFRAAFRARAQAEGLAKLHAELAAVDPAAAARIHPNDAKRIERALEVHHLTKRPISEMQSQWAGPPRYAFVAVGLRREKEELSRRINLRVKQMVAEGLVAEVRGLLASPAGMSEQARAALGYAEIISHLEGRCSLEDAVERIKINTRQFAKHQRTWFRRFSAVKWVDVGAEESAEKTAERVLGLFESPFEH